MDRSPYEQSPLYIKAYWDKTPWDKWYKYKTFKLIKQFKFPILLSYYLIYRLLKSTIRISRIVVKSTFCYNQGFKLLRF